jgi:signal transduction histidine kinase
MDSGNFRYELGLFEVDGFVERAIEVMKPYAGQFRVELRRTTPPVSTRVKADEKRMQQVITNLIANAVKYSPSGDVVHIAVKRLESTVRFEVTDRGAGIPLQYQSTIFKRFGQTPLSSVAPVSSTGLGLSICKSIVDAHGGRIGFDTADSVGTTFWFELTAIGERSDHPTRRPTS